MTRTLSIRMKKDPNGEHEWFAIRLGQGEEAIDTISTKSPA